MAMKGTMYFIVLIIYCYTFYCDDPLAAISVQFRRNCILFSYSKLYTYHRQRSSEITQLLSD